MKTLFLKNMLPAGVIALAVSGAFFTTSMQNAPKNNAGLRFGYNAIAGKCGNIEVNCDDVPSDDMCHISGTTGPLAYDKQAGNNCVNALWHREE
ncbi:hypothetical protein FLAPXU55_02104 [Flavobacterium panici]|uniref:Uncharacterized protein n=2 Tax=Flavobacterium panici TaxID=2654843 RepID=A0A9N8J1L7_9FLAO|nr:hypothetical protein FLAPXU55_02104 [Flavobacterium panici]